MFCLVVQFQGKPPVTDLKMVQTLEAVQSTLQVFLNRYPCVQKDLLARLKYIREQFTVSPYFQTHEVGAFPPRHDCHTTDPASLFVPRAGYWQQYFNRLRQYSCWCLDDRLRQDSPPPWWCPSDPPIALAAGKPRRRLPHWHQQPHPGKWLSHDLHQFIIFIRKLVFLYIWRLSKDWIMKCPVQRRCATDNSFFQRVEWLYFYACQFAIIQFQNVLLFISLFLIFFICVSV